MSTEPEAATAGNAVNEGRPRAKSRSRDAGKPWAPTVPVNRYEDDFAVQVMRWSRLKGSPRFVMLAIAVLADRRGFATMSHDDIAAATCLSRGAAWSATQAAIESGELVVHTRGAGRAKNIFRIRLQAEIEATEPAGEYLATAEDAPLPDDPFRGPSDPWQQAPVTDIEAAALAE